MGRKIYKLWFIVLVILIILSIITLKYNPLAVQRDGNFVSMDTGGEETESSEENSFFSEVIHDFKKFLTISSDAVGYVNGNDSQFNNTTDVLTGHEEINTEKADNKISDVKEDIKENISETKKTVSEQLEEKTTLKEATVSKVVDGDTIYVNVDGEEKKVRLIGIDTPESVHVDESKNTEWGTIASEHTKELLNNVGTVYLEYDTQVLDQYGRTLAYVWLSEDATAINNMLNAKILTDGYAMDKVYEPNEKYAAEFENIRTNAENNAIGLWSDSEFCDLWR